MGFMLLAGGRICSCSDTRYNRSGVVCRIGSGGVAGYRGGRIDIAACGTTDKICRRTGQGKGDFSLSLFFNNFLTPVFISFSLIFL